MKSSLRYGYSRLESVSAHPSPYSHHFTNWAGYYISTPSHLEYKTRQYSYRKHTLSRVVRDSHMGIEILTASMNKAVSHILSGRRIFAYEIQRALIEATINSLVMTVNAWFQWLYPCRTREKIATMTLLSCIQSVCNPWSYRFLVTSIHA